MKTIQTLRFQVNIASHAGMCFGVRNALAAAKDTLAAGPATILGQLAHNPAVKRTLQSRGALDGSITDSSAPTKRVIITAHGASDRDRQHWQSSGYQVTDTTCPLVRVAHKSLAKLVTSGFLPVVIGKSGHVEVNGLTGDFPNATVILEKDEISKIPAAEKLGIISQTTQPLDQVRSLVAEIKRQRPESIIRFVDTVCQPTKDRQTAMRELCRASDLVLAVGGNNSNNTAQLVKTAKKLGVAARQIESPSDLRTSWFHNLNTIGLTAGTSTLPRSLEEVAARLVEIGNRPTSSTIHLTKSGSRTRSN